MGYTPIIKAILALLLLPLLLLLHHHHYFILLILWPHPLWNPAPSAWHEGKNATPIGLIRSINGLRQSLAPPSAMKAMMRRVSVVADAPQNQTLPTPGSNPGKPRGGKRGSVVSQVFGDNSSSPTLQPSSPSLKPVSSGPLEPTETFTTVLPAMHADMLGSKVRSML
jgi:hypothetical protein